MSVVSILWPICKSEGASKIFDSMNYIFLCCLPCKFCKCHKSPEPDRVVWSMPNKQKSFQNPEHSTNYHQMTATSLRAYPLFGIGWDKGDFLGKK